MKKLILILMLLCCGFLYAETETFYTGDTIAFSLKKDDVSSLFALPHQTIVSIIPYKEGFILKTKKEEDYLEYYITEQDSMYLYKLNLKNRQYERYRFTFEKITPNKFTIEYSKD